MVQHFEAVGANLPSKANYRHHEKKLGRARIAFEIEETIGHALRTGGMGLHKIAAEHGVGPVQRTKAELMAR